MPPKDFALTFVLFQRWVFFRPLRLLLLLSLPKNQPRPGSLRVQKTKMANTLPMMMSPASTAKIMMNTVVVVFDMIWVCYTICFFLSFFFFLTRTVSKITTYVHEQIYESCWNQIVILRTTAEGKHLLSHVQSVWSRK